MSLQQRLDVKLDQRLTQEQKLLVQDRILGLRLRLIGKIHRETYKPHAVCPKCSRRLTPLQIIKGFKRNVNDYTTRCPRCHNRFEPEIICKSASSSTTLRFFCPVQTVGQLYGKEKLSPTEIQKNYPALYQSAIAHFGGLTQAFKEIGKSYRFKEPVVKWEKKVKQFLGLLPDSVIACLVQVKYNEVRKLRLRLNIRRYRTENLL
ncbi:MAG: hypothetical protein A3J63_00980 [Candidatus Moranbacteria bacterium RIFCSPHIGHO2_02_FULL_40_12b]|nr:MAG: hypothetical protein A3J63_00980 [Candidatus Moranbacteria bacterium RIFCSPHIGHO2_02_FULL_40_12b]OGI23800.1 MAG: hypothetical protein A3E91_00990 [Candidatus Moranbacteria bacterium RIFCSPHIGHO2_12_FULL_40_10]